MAHGWVVCSKIDPPVGHLGLAIVKRESDAAASLLMFPATLRWRLSGSTWIHAEWEVQWPDWPTSGSIFWEMARGRVACPQNRPTSRSSCSADPRRPKWRRLQNKDTFVPFSHAENQLKRSRLVKWCKLPLW